MPEAGDKTIYAGFWRRFWAYILDSIILFFVVGVVYNLGRFLTFAMFRRFEGFYPIYIDSIYYGDSIGYALNYLIVPWLYYALMESSSKQATVGKMAFEIYVTDMEGRRISFWRASARFFCMFISGFTMGIGYVMAGLTAKRQALHDKITECLVLRRVSNV